MFFWNRHLPIFSSGFKWYHRLALFFIWVWFFIYLMGFFMVFVCVAFESVGLVGWAKEDKNGVYNTYFPKSKNLGGGRIWYRIQRAFDCRSIIAVVRHGRPWTARSTAGKRTLAPEGGMWWPASILFYRLYMCLLFVFSVSVVMIDQLCY